MFNFAKNQLSIVSTFVLSDESINSYGFRILTEGIDTAEFENNPVMLLEHDRLSLIGRWTNLRKEQGRLLADPEFDTDDDLAMKIQNKVEKGFLKGVSVGIQILKLGVETPEGGKEVAVVLKSKLKEGSLCALPSNGNALKLYDANGQQINEKELRLTLSSVLNQHNKNPLKMKIKPGILAFLGLTDGYTEDSLNEQLQIQQDELATLRRQVADANQAVIDTLVDGAVAGGRIKAAQAAGFKSLAQKDIDGVKAILEDMQTPAKPGNHVKPQATNSHLSQREGWDFEKWRKEDPKGLVRLKADHPDKYADLINASQVKRSI